MNDDEMELWLPRGKKTALIGGYGYGYGYSFSAHVQSHRSKRNTKDNQTIF